MRDRAARVDLLSAERVRDELRGLLRGRRPSRGLETLRRGGLLARLLPEIEAMRGVEQGGYHVFDVYGHTLAAVDGAPADIVTRTAALLHDVGKPPCHAIDDRGRHTFHDHPRAGAVMAEALLGRFAWPTDEVERVASLVLLHLRPIQYDPGTTTDTAVRRLVRDAGPLRTILLDLARADTLASAYPTTAGIDELAERMERLDRGGAVSSRRRVLDGETLMRLSGRGPGAWIGAAQRALDEAALDGEVSSDDPEGAVSWLRERRPDLLSG
jgi:poly(A) polymerase